MCLLVAAPGLMAPILLKRAVDALGGVVNQEAVNLTVRALLLSGACRILTSLAKEAQGPTFTPVAQAAGRRVAYHTFSHVLDLDINFHLVHSPASAIIHRKLMTDAWHPQFMGCCCMQQERRTGALSRILERGEVPFLAVHGS